MKKFIFGLFIAGASILGCKNEAKDPDLKINTGQPALSLLLENNSAWSYEQLRLYPVTASDTLRQAQASLAQLKTLAEAMRLPGFRILEQKQFGRTDQNWMNGLTVQNKTQDTVLLLSGDVVKGGNQDRVIAHHEVIMPMSVRNVEVFCVEAGRSTYYNPGAPKAEKQVAAFNGYYNVASPQVRRAIQNTGNQEKVWEAVAKVTKANHAESSTNAYTALDNESTEKARRDAYLAHLGNTFAQRKEVVGVVAVCGNQVIGIDIFGNPELFQRHYPALLHGYVAEAALATPGTALDPAAVQQAFEKVARMTAPHAKSDALAGKFKLGDSWVHIFGK